MSAFVCPKCDRPLSSKQKLDYHMHKKKLPCDYQCRLCDFKGENRFQYYRHMKKEHTEPVELVVAERQHHAQTIDITPIEDFRNFVIEDKDMKISLSICAKTLEGQRRLKTMLPRLATGGVVQVLRQLDSDRDQFLDNTLTGILSLVHSQPHVPQLHSVCLSDIARRSVSFYSRNDEEDCQWVVHPQESSMHLLTQHARDLFSCLLEAGLAALIIQVWKGEDVILTMNTGERTLVIRYDEEHDVISVRTERYDPKHFTECPETRSEEAAALLRIIEQRKDEVLHAVKRAIPKREQIKFFLDHGRPICYPTLQASN